MRRWRKNEEQTGWSGKNKDVDDLPGATQPSKLCSANQEQEEEKEQNQLSTNGEKRAQFAEQVGTRTTSGPPEEVVRKNPHRETQGKGARNKSQDKQH